MNSPEASPTQQLLPWRTLLTAGGLLLLLYVLLPSLGEPPWFTRMRECRNNLKQIELALHKYHDTHGSFPPAITYGPDGKPWHSWRTLLLPYIERGDLFERYHFEEPWNGPHNRELARDLSSLDPFRCPAELEGVTSCSYFAVIGEHTMWPPHGEVSVRDVPDGLSNTIHVVEVSDSGIHWMQPVDLRFDAMSSQIGSMKGVAPRSHHGPPKPPLIGKATSRRVHFALADGAVRPFSEPTPAETVRSLVSRDDGGPCTEF